MIRALAPVIAALLSAPAWSSAPVESDAREWLERMSMAAHSLNYAGTFPQREMGVMLVSDLHRAIGEGLFQVPEFATWANARSSAR